MLRSGVYPSDLPHTVLYLNDGIGQADFWHSGYTFRVPYVVLREFRSSPKITVPPSGTLFKTLNVGRNFSAFSPRRVASVVILVRSLQIYQTERPTLFATHSR